MTTIVGVVTGLALVLFVLGFFKNELTIWLLDTVLWLVWAFLIYNATIFYELEPYNTYLPTALAILGAGMTLIGVYKSVAAALALSKARQRPSADDLYEEEKRHYRDYISSITRRQF